MRQRLPKHAVDMKEDQERSQRQRQLPAPVPRTTRALGQHERAHVSRRQLLQPKTTSGHPPRNEPTDLREIALGSLRAEPPLADQVPPIAIKQLLLGRRRRGRPTAAPAPAPRPPGADSQAPSRHPRQDRGLRYPDPRSSATNLATTTGVKSDASNPSPASHALSLANTFICCVSRARRVAHSPPAPPRTRAPTRANGPSTRTREATDTDTTTSPLDNKEASVDQRAADYSDLNNPRTRNLQRDSPPSRHNQRIGIVLLIPTSE